MSTPPPAVGIPPAGGEPAPEPAPPVAAVEVLRNADRWLAARRAWVIGVLLLSAALCRIVVLVEVFDTPVMYSVRHEEMDMRFFAQWAAHIVEHGPLDPTPLHPVHTWHRHVAAAHFGKFPPVPGKNFLELDNRVREPMIRDLWNEWYGGNRYHQEPLYPHLLALVFWLTGGEDVRWFYGLQLLGGVLSIGLLFGVARRSFGDLVGVLAAAMAIGYGPLIHYELVLLRVSFLVLAGLGLLYVFQRIYTSPRGLDRPLWHWLLVGALVGLATSLKITFAPLAFGLLALVLWPARREFRRWFVPLCSVGGAALLLMTPWFVRNAVVGASLFSLSSVGPVTFAASNYPSYLVDYGWAPYGEDASVLARVMHESHGTLLGAIRSTLALYESTGAYIWKLIDKLLIAWFWFEQPNNTNFYFSTVFSFVLTVMRYLVVAAWVMPAGLVGLGAAFRWRATRAWWWYLGLSFAPLVVFYTLSRFRVPVMVGLFPFAALGLVSVVSWTVRNRVWPTIVALVLFIAGVVWMCRSFRDPMRQVIDAGNYSGALQQYYIPKYTQAIDAGQHAQALAVLERFFGILPDYLFNLNGNHPPENQYEGAFAMQVAGVYQMAAKLANHLGRQQDVTRFDAVDHDLRAAVGAYQVWMRELQQEAERTKQPKPKK